MKQPPERRAATKHLVQLAQWADRTVELWRRGPPENWWIPDETKDAIITAKFTEPDWEFLQEVRLVPEGIQERAAKSPSENCRILLESYLERYCPPVPQHVLEASLKPQNAKERWLVVSCIAHDSQLDQRIRVLEEADTRRVEGLRKEVSFRVNPWHLAKLKEIARLSKLRRTREEAGHVRVARLLIADIVQWCRAQRAKEAAG